MTTKRQKADRDTRSRLRDESVRRARKGKEDARRAFSADPIAGRDAD